jgi:uncharacterized membrane protein
MFGGAGDKKGADRRKKNRILYVVAIMILAGAVVLAFMAFSESEQQYPFTEFYILEPNGAEGTAPLECVLHEPQELILGVNNHEYVDEKYIMEIFLVEEQFDPAKNRSLISSMDLLERHAVNLSHDEGCEFSFRFGIDSPQYNKIELLLHKDEAPPEEIRNEDRINASYRDLHIWIDIRS